MLFQDSYVSGMGVRSTQICQEIIVALNRKSRGSKSGSFYFSFCLGGEEKSLSLTKLTLSPACKNCWTQPLRHPHAYTTFFMSLFQAKLHTISFFFLVTFPARSKNWIYLHPFDCFAAGTGKPNASNTGTPSHSAGMGRPSAYAAVAAVSMVYMEVVNSPA